MPERICAHSELHQKASFLGWLLKSPQPPAAAPDSFNPLMGNPWRPFQVILYTRQLLQLKPVTKLTGGPFAEISQVAPHGVSNLFKTQISHFAILS